MFYPVPWTYVRLDYYILQLRPLMSPLSAAVKAAAQLFCDNVVGVGVVGLTAARPVWSVQRLRNGVETGWAANPLFSSLFRRSEPGLARIRRAVSRVVVLQLGLKRLFGSRSLARLNHRFIYSLLDAVPPIHAESSHVATDKVPSM